MTTLMQLSSMLLTRGMSVPSSSISTYASMGMLAVGSPKGIMHLLTSFYVWWRCTMHSKRAHSLNKQCSMLFRHDMTLFITVCSLPWGVWPPTDPSSLLRITSVSWSFSTFTQVSYFHFQSFIICYGHGNEYWCLLKELNLHHKSRSAKTSRSLRPLHMNIFIPRLYVNSLHGLREYIAHSHCRN